MHWGSFIACIVLFLSYNCAALGASSSSSQEIFDLLISSQHTIMGMHDTIGGEQANGFDTVAQQCGVTLGLWSSDFGFSTHPNDSFRLRPLLLPTIRQRANQGTLITLSWHQCNPTLDEPCTFKDGTQKPLTESEWNELLMDGSALNLRWKKEVDKLALYLKILQKDGIQVLLRPYHESNIPGFWWAHNDANYSKTLWRQLRRYYIEQHGLSNLIWIWSVSFHPRYWSRVAEYYPGNDTVDIIGLDIYPPTKDGMPDFEIAWTTLKGISANKPLALSEVSRLPIKAELEQRKWAYIVPWGKNMLFRDNSAAAICDIYGHGIAPKKPSHLRITPR